MRIIGRSLNAEDYSSESQSMRLDFINVSKIHNSKKQTYNIRDVSISIEEQHSVAVLSTNERSANTLLHLISGIELPTKGTIQRDGVFTGLIGEPSYFHRELSGEENIRFICKIYGQDSNQVIKDVNEFASLGKELKQKAKTYSPPLRRKIAISTSLLMKSDVYQLKGALNHPQPNFNDNIQAKLAELAKKATFIVAGGDHNFLSKYASSSVVIDAQGYLKYFSDVQSGIEAHKALNKGV